MKTLNKTMLALSALLMLVGTAVADEPLKCTLFEMGNGNSFVGLYEYCDYLCDDNGNGKTVREKECLRSAPKIQYYCEYEKKLYKKKPNRCKTRNEVEAEKRENEKQMREKEKQIALEQNQRRETAKKNMGTFTDSRDGISYKTVKIGNQVWMAENLRYKTEKSYCDNAKPEICEKYGRFYEWEAALNACPSGWHLPSKEEFEILIQTVGNKSCERLISTSWQDYYKGTDEYGFTALPAGAYYGSASGVTGVGGSAYFWSSTEGRFAYNLRLDPSKTKAHICNLNDSQIEKYRGLSVRCLKGNPPKQNEDNKFSSMVDSRDGKKYKTVEIGSQVWMAENLNYADSVKNPGLRERSWCYSEIDLNCAKYGRLYTWAAAMDSLGSFSKNGKGCGYEKKCKPIYPVRGICPEGWHLPDSTEWNKMIETLKSENAENTKKYGFSLPGGGQHLMDGGSYMFEDNYPAHFWSTYDVSHDDREDVIEIELSCDKPKCFQKNEKFKLTANSVRCVKNVK